MNCKEEYKTLVQGVHHLEFIDLYPPCRLLLNGANAFPVLVSPKGEVLIAASRYGKGRIVVFPHEGYLNYPPSVQFLQNVLKWLKPSEDALIGIYSSFDVLLKVLSSTDGKVQASTKFSDSFGVYCSHASDDGQAKDIISSLKKGAGILIGGQPWDWSRQFGFGNVMAIFPGNKLTGVAGIRFTGNVGETGIFPVTSEMPTTPVYVQHGRDPAQDLKVLLNDITELNLMDAGAPSGLLLHGALAFPIGLDENHNSFLAGSHYGNGRVVVAAHENILSSQHLKKFILNAISWLDAERKGKVGVARDLKGLQAILNNEKIAYAISDLKQHFTVYCCKAYNVNKREEIQEFVAEGGGLLIGGHTWQWASKNKNQDEIAEFPGNKIVNPLGISIVSNTIRKATYKTLPAEESDKRYHFLKALHYLQQVMGTSQEWDEPLKSWQEKWSRDFVVIMKTAHNASLVFSPIHHAILRFLQEVGLPKVSETNKIKDNSKDAFLLRLVAKLPTTIPNYETFVNQLIGNTQDLAVSTSEKMQINGTSKGGGLAWRSTGLYLAPGKSATIIFPDFAVSAGLQVLIGCHKDDLSSRKPGHKPRSLARPPMVTQKYPVSKAVIRVSSLWGGLLYITVPIGCKLGHVSLAIEGAVLAPFFKLGETSLHCWIETIRHYPAPWAELATDSVILTVSSEYVRSLNDPEELLSLWDRIMKAIAELSSVPFPLGRAERIVTDIQISSGVMHSGYPIMCRLGAGKRLTDAALIQSNGLWGVLHELGHNQQRGGWQISPHTTEATCNLWAVYVSEKVFNISRSQAHDCLKEHRRQKRTMEYLHSGTDLVKHYRVWTCLETYLQVK